MSRDYTRQAKMNCRPNGEPLGVSIVLSAAELKVLGLNPDACDYVEYGVDSEDGEIRLSKPKREIPTE